MIKVELKGPENTLRVRQVKVLGWKEGESIKIPGQISASMAQQKNCEAETLRVFRLITSQVCLTDSSISTPYKLFNCTVCLKLLHFANFTIQITGVSTLLCTFRSLESLSVEMQNRLRSRRRKICFPHQKEKTRSALSYYGKCPVEPTQVFSDLQPNILHSPHFL